MKGKKQALSFLFTGSRLDRLFSLTGGHQLLIFNHHRIRRDGDGPAIEFTEFDDEVFGLTQRELRSQLEWLRRRTHLISEAQLLAHLRDGSPLPPLSTMVTFDDGYADNYSLALPVLKELEVPAIFFIPVQAIEERQLGWWDLITYLLKKSRRPELQLRGERFAMSDRRATRSLLIERLKSCKAEATRGLVEEVAEACEVSLPSREICDKELMTWEQIAEAADSGISIGSHTYTHRVLSTLSLEEQRQELLVSKVRLEAKLRRPVRTLAYPVGNFGHFHLETKQLASECGYEAAFTFTNEVNDLRTLDPYLVSRIAPPAEQAMLASAVAWPRMFVSCVRDLPTPASAVN